MDEDIIVSYEGKDGKYLFNKRTGREWKIA